MTDSEEKVESDHKRDSKGRFGKGNTAGNKLPGEFKVARERLRMELGKCANGLALEIPEWDKEFSSANPHRSVMQRLFHEQVEKGNVLYVEQVIDRILGKAKQITEDISVHKPIYLNYKLDGDSNGQESKQEEN